MLVQISEPAKGKARQSIDHVVNSSNKCVGCYGGVIPGPLLAVPKLKEAGKKALEAFDKANEKKVGKIIDEKIGSVLDPSAIPNFGK